ncbi:MAG: cell division protein ZapA [Byssovorax sp.]
MAGRTVHLRVGGQTYRVTTSSSDEELQRLAAVVDQKIATVVPPGRTVTPQAMLLAAMALAYDLEEERARSATVAARARGAFGRMLQRVDAALDANEGAEVADAASTPASVPVARASLSVVASVPREVGGSSPSAANESRFAPKPSSDP